jgi:uncharacterized protein (TIGR00251 family)
MIALTAHARGTILPVRAQPGARKNAIVGVHAGALRVAVSAAPEKGKANAALQAVLAESLGCKASQVGLLSGETAREKRFLIVGVTPDELRRRLAPLLPPDLFPSEGKT